MWEPEKEKINPQENEETKTSEGIETVAEGILEKKETDPVIEQETGSTNEQPVKIEPWCYNVQEAAKILGVSTTSMHEIIRKTISTMCLSAEGSCFLRKISMNGWKRRSLNRVKD